MSRTDPGTDSSRLAVHTLLPEITLRTGDGRLTSTTECKGRFNLILILTATPGEPLLEALTDLRQQLEYEQARLVVALPPGQQISEFGRQLSTAMVILGEATDVKLHHRLGAIDSAGRPSWAVYVTDRWGEIFAVWQAARGDARPSAEELLSWLAHINHQCEECLPSPWTLERWNQSEQ